MPLAKLAPEPDAPRNTHARAEPAADFLATVAQFALDDFDDTAAAARYIEAFGLRDLCRALDVDGAPAPTNIPDTGNAKPPTAFETKPYEPVYADLARLHFLCLKRKALTVLEFGSGYSTVVMADAMARLHNRFAPWAARNLRVDDPFHVHAVEEAHRFVEITRQRLHAASVEDRASVRHSSVEIHLHDSRLSTVYSKLPNVAPDLIYLDGPSQYATAQEINGLSFASKARMPMSSDILRFEFLLEPGALIVVDGRTANARFLQAYLRRNWAYRHLPHGDIHLFELQESPLGKYNHRKLEFCLDQTWLLA